EHIFRQVCGSLAEAHKKGIVHRDLKPDNVVLTTRAGEKDFAKVLDFGIAARTEASDAKKEQKLTQQGMVLGTPPYMSPEQFTGKELDGRSDVYSLGVMAYEMLTGKLPFEADTPWEWATKHLTERPYPFEVTAPRATLIPDAMKRAIMRALSKNRDERQSDVMAFFEELSGGGAQQSFVTPGDASIGTSGTAAMAAPPPGILQAPVAVAPVAMAPNYVHPPPTANEMVMPVPAPAYSPAPTAKSGGGGVKGILLAVVGLLFVGGIIGAVLIVRSLSANNDDGPDSLNLGLPSATTMTQIAPLDPTTPCLRHRSPRQSKAPRWRRRNRPRQHRLRRRRHRPSNWKGSPRVNEPFSLRASKRSRLRSRCTARVRKVVRVLDWLSSEFNPMPSLLPSLRNDGVIATGREASPMLPSRLEPMAAQVLWQQVASSPFVSMSPHRANLTACR
ncbi:MAG TPA: protein kinase, partial [Polyangiaceae bacterium]|nr:protein kinase [Polyangiaceae bacterium]